MDVVKTVKLCNDNAENLTYCLFVFQPLKYPLEIVKMDHISVKQYIFMIILLLLFQAPYNVLTIVLRVINSLRCTSLFVLA